MNDEAKNQEEAQVVQTTDGDQLAEFTARWETLFDDAGGSASDIKKRKEQSTDSVQELLKVIAGNADNIVDGRALDTVKNAIADMDKVLEAQITCLLYTSPSPRDRG